ncbi:MAG: hypothetical protein IJX28_07465 [Clostridia bacterium]|nr:hypothetical protein [Clostridia bacterium]
MKQRHVKCTVALFLLFATVFVIASCRTQGGIPSASTQAGTSANATTAATTTPPRQTVTKEAPPDWGAPNLFDCNAVIVTFGALTPEKTVEQNQVKYVAVEVSIERVFDATMQESVEKAALSLVTHVYVPEAQSAQFAEGSRAMIMLGETVKDPVSEVHLWQFTVMTQQVGSSLLVLAFPIVDGTLTIPAQLQEQDSSSNEYLVDVMQAIHQGNAYIKDRQVDVPLFQEGMTLDELEAYFEYADKNYYG